MKSRIEIVVGDISTFDVDAIVNAANNTLLGGGGVDGAIHKAAGKKLYEECRSLNGCATGEAKITKGYNLLAKHVIHTVGPIWKQGINNERKQLAKCYTNCLHVAINNNIKTIAFPSISTGAYKFPVSSAARIAMRATARILKVNKQIDKVYFICFDDIAYNEYLALHDSL